MKRNKLKISLASDEKIREISNGEVKSFSMFNFKFNTPKPVINGLFCEKIFGPIRDYVCGCGTKHNRIDSGQVCGDCGVEITTAYTRREYMGHIDLKIPYVNPMGMTLISKALGIPEKFLNALSSGKSPFAIRMDEEGALVDFDEQRYTIFDPTVKTTETVEVGFDELDDTEVIKSTVELDKVPDEYMGNISIYTLMIEMNNLGIDYEQTMLTSEYKDVVEYGKSGRTLDDMFNTVVPVNPPDYRPMTSSNGNINYGARNLIYTRLIRISLRVQNILELQEPAFMELIQYESTVAQRLVNILMIDGIEDYYGEKIKSIVDTLKGKEGMIRGTCLGKRVDYSARSVIISDPTLPLDTLRIPFLMAYELLKPFILGELKSYMIYSDVSQPTKEANRNYDRKSQLAIEFCYELADIKKVIFNRAPSLHRYSVLAFKMKLCNETKAIGVPPMVCTPFNADFDGDTMAVHLIITKEAESEYHLLNVENNLMNSSDHGQPLASPSHEQTVGLYMMTR